LYEQHVASGARLVPFAGWEMPVQYTGVLDEHAAVRERAGLFDVSHMGEALVEGSGALDFLQHVTCNNVARLKPGRAHYTALTTPRGTFVDDLLIYMLAEERYLLVLNAANTTKDVSWMVRHVPGFDVRLTDVSDQWAQIALQGPQAERVLTPLTPATLSAIRYYGFVETRVAGTECLLSRTGYTGEDGFEVYGRPEDASRVWQAMLEEGRSVSAVPIGLAARDTLRLEAKMALYGNDIDDSTTVLEADLGWIVKFKKGEFIGREVLVRQAEEGTTRKLVGFEMRGRAAARHGYPALVDGAEVGRVTSGSFAPSLKKNIGLVYLPIESSSVGREFEVEIRGRREPAVVVETPFYKRER